MAGCSLRVGMQASAVTILIENIVVRSLVEYANYLE